jgi:tetratricopeptide (TPR) repeat protein
MASIIPGFEYDIFISYRQKDNKGDRWVSKFVDALKTELEATFKEDVSVYFDENPHDRLQETHNVDKSLEGKLKCLIFIPVLSQTYCDPNSYAWQYEFLAFLKLAGQDSFGKDIKLRSGNVASRILPIRIHDLESEDIKLFEKETGSVLRSLDFVFKTSAGVNRPLKANEDHPNDNLNKTFFSDQINKTANAIKEIIIGLKTEPVSPAKAKAGLKEPLDKADKEERIQEHDKTTGLSKHKFLAGIAVLAIIIVAAIYAYPKIFKPDKLGNLRSSDGRISVAVMPFQNLTNNTSMNYLQEVVQDNIINLLSNYSEELIIRQTESINSLIQNKDKNNYASLTPSVASSISLKLDANTVICGSIKQEGTTLRVNAQLLNSKTKEVFKSFQIEGSSERIMPIIDSLSVLVKNHLIISKLKREVTPDIQNLSSTSSSEAYMYFIYGENARRKLDHPTAAKWFLKAIEKDSNFVYASSVLISTYYNLGQFDQGKKLCLQIYKKRDQLPKPLQIIANRQYALFFETPYDEIRYLKQQQELDDQSPTVYYQLGFAYHRLNQYDKAIPEFEKALAIYKKWGTKPYRISNYTFLGLDYNKTGQYRKEKKLYEKAENYFPDYFGFIYRRAILSLCEGKINEANAYIERVKLILKEGSESDANISLALAGIYDEANMPERAEEYYRQVLVLEPENPTILNNIAYFFYRLNINIDEGLNLINKALQLNPDNFIFLATKGELLYKQGKYKEALALFEKSWELKPIYNHDIYLDIQMAKKAVAGQKRID